MELTKATSFTIALASLLGGALGGGAVMYVQKRIENESKQEVKFKKIKAEEIEVVRDGLGSIKILPSEPKEDFPSISITSKSGAKVNLSPQIFYMKSDTDKRSFAVFLEDKSSFINMFLGDRSIITLASDAEGSRIELSDKEGRTRASIGATSLVNKNSGTVTRKSEASVVLFNKKGDVTYELPVE